MSTPQERFVAEIDAIRAQIDRLADPAVVAIRAELEGLRRQVLAEIAGLRPDTYTLLRLQQLEARLADVSQAFAERYARTVAPFQQDAALLGAELAGAPLVVAGEVGFVPQISRRAVEVARLYQARLIRDATAAAVQDISATLRRGVLTGQSVFEVLGTVAGSLDGPGSFGDLATRAEAITRTELGRISSVAQQAGAEDMAALVPDLQKQWTHSGSTGRYRRTGHVEADGQVVEVRAAYRVRPSTSGARSGYEALRYPRDAAGSPENTVFCGCLSQPFKADWADAIQQARDEVAARPSRRGTRFEEAPA